MKQELINKIDSYLAKLDELNNELTEILSLIEDVHNADPDPDLFYDYFELRSEILSGFNTVPIYLSEIKSNYLM